jgi:hypothetical protein
MTIPSYLNLEQRQIDKLARWSEAQAKPTMDQHDEMYGGACMTSPVRFEIRNCSICTEIKAVNEFTGSVCDLTIDDDNELAP